MPSRRAVLGAAVGAVVLSACGEDKTAVPRTTPGELVEGSFVSKARGGVPTGWAVSYPPGSTTDAALPVAVFLHGLHQSHGTAFGRAHLGLDRYLASYVEGGGTPYALASVVGGTSYWHPHPGHGDTGAMVLDELLPLLAGRGLRTERIGLTGLSMGGYGALRLAGILGPDRCAVVAVESPALWTDAGDASASGFDSAAEYRRYSVFGHQADLAGIPVRIACGKQDPFLDATKAYVAGFPKDHRPSAHYAAGGHDTSYWRRVAPAQLAFVGKNLSASG